MTGTLAPPRTRLIEVFADVGCPFTHVGLRRLVAERARRGRDDVAIRVRAWPLELVNGVPLAPDLVAEEVEALRASVAPDLFVGFDASRFPHTSLPAFELAAAAAAEGDARGEAVSLALRDALFEQGRDIADPAVLHELARAHGVDAVGVGARRQVHDDLLDGRRRDVVGSPSFFSGGRSFFCPTLDIARVDDHLRIGLDPHALAGFLAAVFDDERP